MKAAELYEKVTASIIKSIKAGIASPQGWKAPWSSTGFYPTNASTGRRYRGGNVFWFHLIAEEAGYPTAWWATYKQWTELGRQVEKGQKGTPGIKWVFPEPGAVAKAKASGGKVPTVFPTTFTVFNFAQTVPAEGATKVWEPPAVRESSEVDAIALDFFGKVGSKIVRGGEQAYYDSISDYIALPSVADFTTPEGHLATAAHEHTHWTGHKDRLNRDLANRFGSEAYAAEELVAELGAAFVCGQLGVSSEPREDHAQYLKSWLKVLSNDDKAFYAAASLAQKAVDFLFEKAGATEAPAVERELVSA